MAVTVDRAIAAYIALRDERDALKARQADELAAFTEKLDKLEGWLHRQLQREGVDSFKVRGVGTAFTQKMTRAKVVDWPVTLEYIKENDAFELLEARVSKKVVEDYIANGGGVPPGVDWTEVEVVQVRRDSK